MRAPRVGGPVTPPACVAAALPAVVSTIRGLAAGAVPNGDRGVIATRAYDVFTSHTPLVGQSSATSLVIHRETHSLGPMLYWLLSVPSRIGPAAMTVAMGAVSAACACAVVLLARRRGGTGLMVATAIAFVLMCRSLPAEILHDIYNPSAGVMPFALLIFLGWSVASGEVGLLPVAVLVASYATQCELTFALPSAALLVVAVTGLAWARALRWKWLLAAAAVGLVCWSAPLVDQVAHSPGNLANVMHAATATRHSLGARAGWRAVVRAVGVPPRWLRISNGPFDRASDVTTKPPAATTVSAIAILAGLVASGAGGALRRRRDVATAAAIALVLCAALGAVAAATPTRPILMMSLGYTLWWGSPAGMFVWLALGWSAIELLGPMALPARARLPAAAGAAAAALGAGAAVALAAAPDQDRPEYGPVRSMTRDVRAALARGDHTIRVAGSASFTAFDFKGALFYALRRSGLRPVAIGASRRLGRFYEVHDHRYEATVYVWDGPRPLKPGHVVERIPLAAAAGGRITVTVAPNRASVRSRRSPPRTSRRPASST